MDCSTPGFLVLQYLLELAQTHVHWVGDAIQPSRPLSSSVVIYFIHSSVYIGEGNGTPLQYSCLENPMDWGAWWAAVHGVAKSRTRLSDFTLTFHFHALEKEMATHSLQCSCLENPRDGGAGWAAVYGVTQSQTRLKWLSSSSMVVLILVFEKPPYCFPQWLYQFTFPLTVYKGSFFSTSLSTFVICILFWW